MALAVRIRDSSVTSNIAVSIMRSLQARQVRRLAPAVCLGVVLAGCAGTPRITALHDPLYRADGHTSTITATARVTQSSIAEIRIEAISGTPAWCPTGSLVPSLMPCRTNAVNIVSACGFSAGRTEASCALNRTITGGRMISYRTTTRAANGRTASTPWVTYAAGPWPLTEYQLNLGIIRVQLDIEAARPVIWRTDAPGPAAAADKIDLGFVPDADYFAAGGGNYRQFSDDISSIATRTFYTDTRPSTNFTRTWRNIYNLWAGPRGADGEGCTRNFNQQTNAIRAALDGVAIVHRNAFRDCATLTRGGGGAGTVESTQSNVLQLLVHESGHFLFGLGDEYSGGGNSAVSLPKNVLGSQSSCQSTSTANSLPSGQCVQIGTTGTWRNDDGQISMMASSSLDSDFRTLSLRAVSNMVSACSGGSCY